MRSSGGRRYFGTLLLLVLPSIALTNGDLTSPSKLNREFQDSPTHDDRGISREFPKTVSITADSMGVDVEGFTMKTIEERDIFAFQGIRYAPNPTRFQPPQKLDPDYYVQQNSTIIANHLPDKCAQHGVLNPNLAVGKEDCLFLNVYTPQLQDSDGNFSDLLPVMLFIHGGGFQNGDTSLYLPTRFLDKDVILVTIQYRLAIFGFYTTETSEAKGNAGLYDQQMAMQWVQTYIKDFGGDPSRVTIFGESAGSASASYHLLSQYSVGLFQGVIGESGSPLEQWALDPDPLASYRRVAEELDCAGDLYDVTNVHGCFLGATMEELITVHTQLAKSPYFVGGIPVVQDFLEPEEDPIVPTSPEDSFSNGGLQANVNLMIGANRDEGSYIFGNYYNNFLLPNNLVNDSLFLQEGLIPSILDVLGIDDKTHALSESLADEYLKDADMTDFESMTPGMIDLISVLFFKAGAYETAKLHSMYKDEDAKTFFYSFEYLSDDTMFDFLMRGNIPPIPHGVTHTDEMMYIYSFPADLDEEQLEIKDRMVELWTNFAIFLDPTPEESKGWRAMRMEKWEEFDIITQNFLVMEETFHVEQDYTNRWTINTQGTITPSSTPANDGSSTAETGSFTGSPSISETTSNGPPDATAEECSHDEEINHLNDDLDEMTTTKNVYMGLMISFIFLFCCSISLNGFLIYRRK